MKLLNKIGAGITSLALVCALSPAAALAATSTSSSAPTETKTITWLSTETQPKADQTITVGGEKYTLTNTSEKKIVKTEYGTTTATKTEWKDCYPADLNATMASFAETKDVDEDGFAGSIPRTSVTYVPTQATETAEVNVTKTTSGLKSNDASQIASTIEETTEWDNTVTLKLASLSWTVDKTDERGLPSSYTATAIYRGLDSRAVIDHYTVTATWEGTVTAKEPVYTYEATLTYTGPEPTVTATTTEPEPETPFNWLPVIVGAVAAAAAVGGFVFWYRRRDVRVCRAEGDTLKVVAQLTSQREVDGALKVELPAQIDLVTQKIALTLRKDKASGCPLHVYQFGKLVATLDAHEMVWVS